MLYIVYDRKLDRLLLVNEVNGRELVEEFTEAQRKWAETCLADWFRGARREQADSRGQSGFCY
jgi:hypothetical protein